MNLPRFDADIAPPISNDGRRTINNKYFAIKTKKAMKIKKIKKQHVVSKMFAIAVVMMIGVAFTACSSNEDPKPNPDAVKYVDLGLPSGTKWAACNLGATKPEEYGDLYA